MNDLRSGNDLIRIATVELARFLSAKLPDLSIDWWQKHVFNRLSLQQQRRAEEHGYRTLQQLDLAALLRVLDQNWYELGSRVRLPREARSWVKELQTVRNNWAHPSAESIPASEVYRDADTLGRLLAALDADAACLEAVEGTKTAALEAMAATTNARRATTASPPSDIGMIRDLPVRPAAQQPGLAALMPAKHPWLREHLTKLAMAHGVASYGEIANRYPGYVKAIPQLFHHLDDLIAENVHRREPLLSVLVVNSGTRIPGPGFMKTVMRLDPSRLGASSPADYATLIRSEMERVWSHRWE